MENQHKLIKGYRELSKEEIDMMNEAKELLAKCKALAHRVEKHVEGQYQSRVKEDNEYERLSNAQPFLWLHQSKISIETGFMQLIRSIAQPTT